MAVSTRQLHRKNLRNARDVIPENEPVLFDTGDDLDHQPRGLTHHPQSTPPAQSPSRFKRSSAVFEALSDVNSKLARFLFLGGSAAAAEDDDEGGLTAWFMSFRHRGGNHGNGNGNDDEDEMPSMSDARAVCYAMALEPMEIRNERVIQLFEAYAIFGALFMNAVWILYEWGSYKAHGGDGSNVIVERIFECVMALALSCNMFLALLGAWYWVYSILMNSSHQDYVFQSIKPMMYLYYLICFTGNLVWVGMLLGIYCNLSPYWPETIVSLVVALIVCFSGSDISVAHMLSVSPLELYHLPSFSRHVFLRKPFFTKKEKDDLKAHAKMRANELRKLAYNEKKKLDPNFQKVRTNNNHTGVLLRAAARNCGRDNTDISIYEARLEEDWLSKPEQLNGMSAECLSRYMPLGLAKEVQKLVEAEFSRSETIVELAPIPNGDL
mmetsp:Transcript_9181/g.19827  ORF Transcript_9181/g.19827 Transcript_9181/m.19827 type:complete len:438 (-) Transcript_9181:181-1494(-)